MMIVAGGPGALACVTLQADFGVVVGVVGQGNLSMAWSEAGGGSVSEPAEDGLVCTQAAVVAVEACLFRWIGVHAVDEFKTVEEAPLVGGGRRWRSGHEEEQDKDPMQLGEDHDQMQMRPETRMGSVLGSAQALPRQGEAGAAVGVREGVVVVEEGGAGVGQSGGGREQVLQGSACGCGVVVMGEAVCKVSRVVFAAVGVGIGVGDSAQVQVHKTRMHSAGAGFMAYRQAQAARFLANDVHISPHPPPPRPPRAAAAAAGGGGGGRIDWGDRGGKLWLTAARPGVVCVRGDVCEQGRAPAAAEQLVAAVALVGNLTRCRLPASDRQVVEELRHEAAEAGDADGASYLTDFIAGMDWDLAGTFAGPPAEEEDVPPPPSPRTNTNTNPTQDAQTPGRGTLAVPAADQEDHDGMLMRTTTTADACISTPLVPAADHEDGADSACAGDVMAGRVSGPDTGGLLARDTQQQGQQQGADARGRRVTGQDMADLAAAAGGW